MLNLPPDNTIALQSDNATPMRKNRYTVSLARTAREVEESQRLRYQVFFEEMGATARSRHAELDVDEYDDDCEHLIVRDQETLSVVGCYRIMRPDVARRRGAFYSDSEFDLSRLHTSVVSRRQRDHAAVVGPGTCGGRERIRIRNRLRQHQPGRWSRQCRRRVSRIGGEVPRTTGVPRVPKESLSPA